MFINKKTLAILFSALFLSMSLAKDSLAQAGRDFDPISTDSRIRTLVYNENEVYVITTNYGFQSNIEFSKEEQIQTISVGDQSAWQIIPAGRHLFIKALEETIRTNMTVITNKRVYQFDLVAKPTGDKNLSYVIRFFYPELDDNKPKAQMAAPVIAQAPKQRMPESSSEQFIPARLPNDASEFGMIPPPPPSFAGRSGTQEMEVPVSKPPVDDSELKLLKIQSKSFAKPQPDSATKQLAEPKKAKEIPSLDKLSPPPPSVNVQQGQSASGAFNFNYTLTGPDVFAPVKVFDDGQNTYMQFRDGNKIVPEFAVVDKDGKEIAVQTRFQGDFIVIDQVATQFSLRNNNQIVCVYNESKLTNKK